MGQKAGTMKTELGGLKRDTEEVKSAGLPNGLLREYEGKDRVRDDSFDSDL